MEKDRHFPPDKEEEKQPGEDSVINTNLKENDEGGQIPVNGAESTTVEETGDNSPDRAAELQSRIEEIEQEKQELTGRLLRLQADFDNYRKRMRMEKETLEEYANFGFIQKLLPVLDNLERASSASAEARDAVVEGLSMITRQFTEILEKEGVVPIECRGKPFDPNYHEAVLQEKDSEHAPGTVLQEIQKGYLMKDKVLRVSMVKVSCE